MRTRTITGMHDALTKSSAAAMLHAPAHICLSKYLNLTPRTISEKYKTRMQAHQKQIAATHARALQGFLSRPEPVLTHSP